MAAAAGLNMPGVWLDLLLHFLALSLLAIGGAITTVPEMHRYLVSQRGWLAEADFTSAIALAQAAPGPNLLFVVVLGYQVAGLAGAAASLAGMLLPSATLTLAATRWARANREWRGVRAFNAGMTPLTLGLILSSGWLLAAPFLRAPEHRWSSGALMVLTIVLTLRTRINLVWLVLGGGVLGALRVV